MTSRNSSRPITRNVTPYSNNGHSRTDPVMKLNEKQRTYWHLNLALTAALLSVCFITILVCAIYAVPFNRFQFFGFPLSFYIFSQGALLIFVLLVGIHVLSMNRLDRRFNVDERR